MLNVNEPTDTVLVSEIPAYIRADRVAINAVSGSGNVGKTALTVAPGSVSLSVGTDLGSYGLELVLITGGAAVVLGTILGGTDGMVKIFISQDALITWTDGPKATGQFYLNHLPALSGYTPVQDSVLALINVGGNGSTNHGYWKELFRTNAVK